MQLLLRLPHQSLSLAEFIKRCVLARLPGENYLVVWHRNSDCFGFASLYRRRRCRYCWSAFAAGGLSQRLYRVAWRPCLAWTGHKPLPTASVDSNPLLDSPSAPSGLVSYLLWEHPLSPISSSWTETYLWHLVVLGSVVLSSHLRKCSLITCSAFATMTVCSLL